MVVHCNGAKQTSHQPFLCEINVLFSLRNFNLVRTKNHNISSKIAVFCWMNTYLCKSCQCLGAPTKNSHLALAVHTFQLGVFWRLFLDWKTKMSKEQPSIINAMVGKYRISSRIAQGSFGEIYIGLGPNNEQVSSTYFSFLKLLLMSLFLSGCC